MRREVQTYGEFQGIPATGGRQVALTFVHRKLAELWIEVNILGMLEQIGFIPSQQARLR